jgi:hypothetical protein
MDEVASERSVAGGAHAAAGDDVVDDTLRTSYRLLRLSVVALALLLATSLALEIARRGGEQLGSISAYYYSPVRSVLVGSLVAIAPALIAIKGRRGWEDALLDIAGMVVPLVAVVPASRTLGTDVCGPNLERCIPPELEPAVENNVTSLLVVGAAALLFAWWSRGRIRERTTALGLVAATGVWLASTLWFWLGRDSFLAQAHYVAAIVFFGLVAAVAFLNGRQAPGRLNVPVLAPIRYGQAYRAIGGLMVATILVAIVLFAGNTFIGLELWFSTTFLIEAVLLGLFVTFWIFQTAENWDEEAVEEQRTRARRSSPGTSS